MAKLNIRSKQIWVSTVDRVAASYGYSQIDHELIDTSESGMSKVEYRFTLCSNVEKRDTYKLVISAEESEGPPKKDNLYFFDAGTIDIPGNLTDLFVPVTISRDEFNVLIDNIVLALLCYMVYARIDTEMTTNIERLTRDIKDKKDLSGYTGVNVYDRVVALFKQGVHRPESTQK